MDSKHYVDSLETPHLSQLNNKAKQDVLDQDSQSLFGSPASKVNVHNNTAAEMIAMQKMFSTIFFIRKVLEEMCGQRVRNLRCVALTDHDKLFSNINQFPANIEDFRLQSDILELRQSILQEKTVQEVRYVHPSLNIADALTKSTKTGIMLLQLVQTG